MIDSSKPLVLGSSSPRRREILLALCIPIRVVPGNADEAVRNGERPAAYLERVVREKLASVATQLDEQPCGGVLVADTSVLLGDDVLGKPADEQEARTMLRALSGRKHAVWSRFALAAPDAPSRPIYEETVKTDVYFRQLTEGEIVRYAASGEGSDKAGAYAVQGLGAFAVARVDGSYPNVVGLPSCEIVAALLSTGLLGAFPP